MKSTNRFFWLFLGLIILGASVYGIFKVSPRFLDTIGLRKVETTLAPDFELKSLSGESYKLSDLRGKRVILSFWTSWNKISLEQIKTLNDHFNLKPDDLVILSINSQESPEIIENALAFEKIGVNFPILIDEEGEAGELYDIGFLPLTVFVNKAGIETGRKAEILSLEELIQASQKF